MGFNFTNNVFIFLFFELDMKSNNVRLLVIEVSFIVFLVAFVYVLYPLVCVLCPLDIVLCPLVCVLYRLLCVYLTLFVFEVKWETVCWIVFFTSFRSSSSVLHN